MDLQTLIVAMSIPSGVTAFCFWMIEQKIPAGLRDGLPLVCDQLGPVLVCGGIARDRQSRGKPAWVLAVRRIT